MSLTPTVATEFRIGLYDPAEADLEHFWNCCSAVRDFWENGCRARYFSGNSCTHPFLAHFLGQLVMLSYCYCQLHRSQRHRTAATAEKRTPPLRALERHSGKTAGTAVLSKTSHANCYTTLMYGPSRGRRGRFQGVAEDDWQLRRFSENRCTGHYSYSLIYSRSPRIPHCNCSRSVPNRPLWGRSGRFGTLFQQLECGIFGRTAVRSGFFYHLLY